MGIGIDTERAEALGVCGGVVGVGVIVAGVKNGRGRWLGGGALPNAGPAHLPDADGEVDRQSPLAREGEFTCLEGESGNKACFGERSIGFGRVFVGILEGMMSKSVVVFSLVLKSLLLFSIKVGTGMGFLYSLLSPFKGRSLNEEGEAGEILYSIVSFDLRREGERSESFICCWLFLLLRG